MWEVLEGTLKRKIEIQWADIEAIRAVIRDDEPGILEIEVSDNCLSGIIFLTTFNKKFDVYSFSVGFLWEIFDKILCS